MAGQQIHLQHNVRGFYYGTKAAIEALVGVPDWSIGLGYTTTPADAEFGFFDGTDWQWGGTGGGGAGFNDAEGDPSNVDGDVAADGTSTYAARRDHVHFLDMSTFIDGLTIGGSPDVWDVIFYRRDLDGGLRKIDFDAFINNLLTPNLGAYFSEVLHSHDSGEVPVDHFDLDNAGAYDHDTIDGHLISASNPHNVTAAQVAAIPVGGWEARSETWTRTGNHTFTVPGDLTSTYRKYRRVQYNDGAVDYGTILSSSHAGGTTTVNLIPNTSYLMAATTITGTYVSSLSKPTGFPDYFNYTPATIPWTLGNGTAFYRFFPRADGHMEHDIYFLFGSTSSITGANYTPPAQPVFSEMSASRFPVALVSYLDASPAASYAGVVLFVAVSSVFGLRALNPGFTYVQQSLLSTTAPFTWATGDGMSIHGVPYPY